MASFREEIALAAARTRTLAEHLPPKRRDELLVEWGNALDEIEDATTARAAERALSAYRDGVEARLCGVLAHLPLERVPR